MFHSIKVIQSSLSALLEKGKGVSGTSAPKQPALPIKLYDIESCAACRQVREVLTTLNLDVEIYPCPINGTHFRPHIEKMTGGTAAPVIIDENTGLQLVGVQQIVDYLFKQYGYNGKTPSKWQHLVEQPFSGKLVNLSSAFRGRKANPANAGKARPLQMLQLWSFEASPFSRLVREKLCELELPYVLHNVAKERWQDQGPAALRLKPGKYAPMPGGKRSREILINHKMQVPYLIDPNTGVSMYESKDILQYLDHTYA